MILDNSDLFIRTKNLTLIQHDNESNWFNNISALLALCFRNMIYLMFDNITYICSLQHFFVFLCTLWFQHSEKCYLDFFFTMILHFCFSCVSSKSINFLMFSLAFSFIKVLYSQSRRTASDYVMNNIGVLAGHYSAGLIHFWNSQNTEIAVLWM